MTAVKKFLYSHRVFFGLFAFLTVYEIVIGNNLAPWRISDDFYVFYTVDFGMGFCSRLLPGALYHLLLGAPEQHKVSVYTTVFTVLFFAGVCLLLEQLIKHTQKEDRPLCLFFVLLFLTGPASFSIFVVGLGIMDFYWMLFALLFFVFLARRPLYFFIPPLFALCVFVHYGSMICYIPLMAIILLYKISVSEDRRARRLLWATFISGVVLAFGATVYVMAFEEKQLVYSMQEFDDIIRSRGAKLFYYYDYEFYKVIVGPDGAIRYDYTNETGNFIVRLVRHALAQMDTTFTQHFKNGSLHETVLALLAILPVEGVIFASLWDRFRDRDRKNLLRSAAIVFTAMLYVLMLACAVFFSTDTFRWLSHMFLCLTVFFFYISLYEGDRLWPAVRRFTGGAKAPLCLLFLLYYAVLAPTH